MENLFEAFNEDEFCRIYRGTREFCETPYYRQFLNFLTDGDLVDKVKFANDILHIPPVKTFISIYKTFFAEQVKKEPFGKMKPQDKQGLGACFGYLYRIIYKNYEPEQAWVGDVKEGGTGIKTASFFVKTK